MVLDHRLPALILALSSTLFDQKILSHAFHVYYPATARRQAASLAASVLAGVPEFERWFSSVPGSECATTLAHNAFDNLRGLSYNSKQPPASDVLCRVPRSVVLQSDFSQLDWDATLAMQLWEEVAKGESSDKYGYCKLLSKSWSPNDGGVPEKAAPDAIRHWTAEQKSLLEASDSGRRLIELQKKQESQWKEKYDRSQSKGKVSFEQFAWAMEVVHSRAFKGDFGDSSPIPPIVSGAAPILVAAAGYYYAFQFQGDNILVYAGLAALGAAPILVNALSTSPASAVLLPLIDSANHKESADSSIDYDPLTKSFALTAGPKCYVEEGDQIQFYISYGAKKDSELLLNYGFLPDLMLSGADENEDRKKLAEAFNARNA